MKIVILGAGKMGSFFADVLSFDHEIALYDIDPHRLRFAFNTLRMTRPEEIQDFTPDLVINAATVKYTIEAFQTVLPYLPAHTILSDIASVKTGLPEFYAQVRHQDHRQDSGCYRGCLQGGRGQAQGQRQVRTGALCFEDSSA